MYNSIIGTNFTNKNILKIDDFVKLSIDPSNQKSEIGFKCQNGYLPVWSKEKYKIIKIVDDKYKLENIDGILNLKDNYVNINDNYVNRYEIKLII
jgi:hypothetical protein